MKDVRAEVIQDTLEQLSDEPVGKTLGKVLESRLDVKGGADSALFHEIYQEIEGFGPIQELLDNENVSEILINNSAEIYVEKDGLLSRHQRGFVSSLTFDRFVKRLLFHIDKVADQRHPHAEGTLPDGTRVHILVPPITRNALVSLRRHRAKRFTLADLTHLGMMSESLAQRLHGEVHNRRNILICGATGTGKTTLLRSLLDEVHSSERIITIEDTLEINLSRPNGLSLNTRITPDEVAPSITLTDLLRHSLRMRPDRIVVGEIRGEEALVFLDAVSTGHGGSLSSIHSDSSKQALSRLESLASRAAPQWPLHAVRELIFEAVDLVVCLSRDRGTRRICDIAELTALESFGYLMDSWEIS